MPRFAYVYFMADEPQLVRDVAPRHTAYWHGRGLSGYVGGPFADRSGGLITFVAADDGEARPVVDGDPFVQERLLRQRWLNRWEATGAVEPDDQVVQTALDGRHVG